MRLKNLILALLLVMAGTVQAQMNMVIPADTAVRMGKLPNGLTYYIRYNNWPEHRANFYIAQKVGSLQEEESQRGLAHFLEHMCFNGTDHFEGNGLIRYCESIGLQFGGDLNAYTSIEQTVYNIDNVPTTRQSTLDSCLLILYDWANGLTLDPEEIDKERGVIHQEWRQRSSASQRMLERALPQLYPGSKYGQRMPIGLMSVIDNFKPKELRDYYEKWYNPENQGIIVVGDVDVNHIENKIKELFGGIKPSAEAGKVLRVAVPDNAEPIVVVEKDKEQRNAQLQVFFKHETMPDSLRPTFVYMMSEYLKSTAFGMLQSRYQEATQKADCPYLGAQAGDGGYIFSKTKDALTISVVPKEGKSEEALTAAITELRRAAEFGFTATEYERVKQSTLSALDKMYSNRDKRTNSQYYNSMLGHFLDNEAMPSIDFTYNTMKQVVPNIPLDAINQMMKEMVVLKDSNMVVLSFNPEKEGVPCPTKESLMAAINAARSAEVTAYVDNMKNEPLIKQFPKPGKIVKEVENKQFGYKVLTLSNGISVVLKHTDFKKDAVSLSGECKGGSSLYGMNDWANLQMFNQVIGISGLGGFSSTELSKALAGKIANADLGMGETSYSISGSSTPKDVETMLQMVYLYMTDITKDEDSFKSLMTSTEMSLKTRATNPMSAFSDSTSATIYGHHPRIRPMVVDDLKNVDYDRILAMAKEITANPAAYRYTIIGNFDEATLRPLLCQYLAALPAKKKVKAGHRIALPVKGKVTNQFKRKMETPKAIDLILWHNDKMAWTQENSIKADVAGQILSMVYLKKIREDAGAAYSVGAQGELSHYEDGYTQVSMVAQCPMQPEKADLAQRILREEADALAEQCDESMLAKVKEQMLKQHEVSLKSNGYWASIVKLHVKYGVDWHSRTSEIISALQPQDICNFMKEFLKEGNRIEVCMMPE